MSISYKKIRDNRQWRASTGLNESQFKKLVKEFKITYEDFLGETISKRINNSGSESRFVSYEELLFFLLYSIKSGLTYDLLGLSFDLDRGNVFRTQSFGLRILEMSLQRLDFMPKRFFEDLDDFKETMSEEEQLILDASEQRRQRPQNQEDQKDDYSGKKNLIP
ncbi:MAG: hypothetical protein AB8F74_22855 [Saprospiraceae bacterium]